MLEDPVCSKRNQLHFHVKSAPDYLVMHFEDTDDDEYDYAVAMEDDVKVGQRIVLAIGRRYTIV